MAYKYKLTEMSKTASSKDAEKELDKPRKGFEVGQVTFADNGLTKSTITDINPETGAVSWKVTPLPGFDKLYDDLTDLVTTSKRVYVKTKDDKKFREIYDEIRVLRNKVRTHLRNEYPDEYKRITDQVLENDVDEISTSGAAGAYLTPYAFRKKGQKANDDAYKELGYKEVKEDSQIKISKPRYVKDKNNPNFLNIYIDYETPGGAAIALGKETMSGQIRRKSAAAAVDKLNSIAKDLTSRFDVEDIEVTDLENGKAKLFAVSDDFIDIRTKRYPGINEAIDLVHVYDKDGKIFGTGEIEKELPNDKVRVRFDGNFVGTFRADRVKPVQEGVGADLGPGPKAGPDGVTDSAYTKQFKYKLVPKNKDGTYVQKGSTMPVRKLWGE